MTKTPTTSYSNWTYAVGAAAARYNAMIAFGPATYDAWASGVSADDYAAAHRHWPARVGVYARPLSQRLAGR